MGLNPRALLSPIPAGKEQSPPSAAMTRTFCRGLPAEPS